MELPQSVRLDAFISPLGTVYNSNKLFEIIANCSLSNPYHLKPILNLAFTYKITFLTLQ